MSLSIWFWILFAASVAANVYFAWPNGKSIASTVLYHVLIAIVGVAAFGSAVK